MNFETDPVVEDFRARIRAFVDERIIPLEQDPDARDEGDNISPARLEELRELARKEGLWCLQLPENLGGRGLGKIGMAVCYEEMNRSIFGPVVFNSAAPDDGNMMVLAKAATPEQQDKWLRPIAEGRVRSAFVMTEPHPGSGSDPAGMMRT
ncbi:MAG TPA: acyl-CoA dehydrogenase family protein, partial [Arenicellales bacterium]|nr:acyl-CoA dehydrogenase family protein [Arenicellales bacterium]